MKTAWHVCGQPIGSTVHYGKLRKHHVSANMQAVLFPVTSISILESFAPPKITIEEFQRFLHRANEWLRRPVVLVGDLNIRGFYWYVPYYRTGPEFRTKPCRHGLVTERTPAAILVKRSGSSRVDLCFNRNCRTRTIHVLQLTTISDRAPVTENVHKQAENNDESIPISVIEV